MTENSDYCGSDAGRDVGIVRAAGVSVRWSPDFGAYARGEISAAQVRCVLCEQAPCDCPPFGSEEYFKLLDRRHGNRPASPAVTAPMETDSARLADGGDGKTAPTRPRVT